MNATMTGQSDTAVPSKCCLCERSEATQSLKHGTLDSLRSQDDI